MNFVNAKYNKFHNCIDVTHYEGYILRFDCNMIEESLKMTPCSQCAVNALAIDEPLQYVTMYLEGSFQSWIDCEDNPIIY
jgi:hypothetical protein